MLFAFPFWAIRDFTTGDIISLDPWSVLKNSIILVRRRFLDWDVFQTWIDSNEHTSVEPVRLKSMYPYLEMRVTVTGDDITWYFNNTWVFKQNAQLKLIYCYSSYFPILRCEHSNIITVRGSDSFIKQNEKKLNNDCPISNSCLHQVNLNCRHSWGPGSSHRQTNIELFYWIHFNAIKDILITLIILRTKNLSWP